MKTLMSRPVVLWAALLAGVWASYRLDGGLLSLLIPGDQPSVVDVDALSQSLKAFKTSVSALSPKDRAALGEFYVGFGRAVEADPQADPVIKTTTDLRAAHRAGLLFLWRGFLGNASDKYSGLRESIEGVLTEFVGSAEVPLNPAIRASGVAACKQMAALCQSAKP